MIRSCLLLLSIAFWEVAVLAAENSQVVTLEPSKEFPRNSEGAFVTLKSGRVVFLYTQFYGGKSDGSPARIVAIHSDDAGRTWNREPRTVVENQAGANVMSVSALRLKSGRIALFYLVKNSWLDCRPHLRFSDDEAESWSEPRLVVPAPGYFVVNNDRVVQLSTGRLVVPVAFHRSKLADPGSRKSFDSRATDFWQLSDDEGLSWREADTWLALPAVPTTSGLQEPGCVELADGKLLGWARTDQGSEWMTTSADGGKTWALPAASDMKSPVSPASIKRLPGSDDLLGIWNDHSGQFEYVPGKRTPLVSGISSDGGKTWTHRKLLESDSDGCYCYTAIHFVDNAVLLAYCAGDSQIGNLSRLRMRRIDLDWLRAPATAAVNAAAFAAFSGEKLSLDPQLRERCLAVLRAGLASDEFWPAMHAAEALTLAGQRGEVLAGLRRRTPSDDQQRCGLAREAVRAGDRAGVAVLLEILDKPESNGHMHAAESLYKIREIGDGEKLRAAAAQDANLKLRLMADAALGRRGDAAALDDVRRRVSDPDQETAKIAAWLLGQIGAARDAAALEQRLKSVEDPLARAYFVNALACLGDAGARRELGTNLGSPNLGIRTYAAEFAGYCRAVELRDKLAALLDDSVLDVRVRAAQSLIVLASGPELLGLPFAITGGGQEPAEPAGDKSRRHE